MPSGFAGIKQASEEIEARRNSGGGGFFKLDPGQSAVVRFLEQGDGIHWCWAHEVPVAGRQFGEDVPCIDKDGKGDPCPGCERDIKRRVRGHINVIWREAPKLVRDSEGKTVRDGSGKVQFDGTEDRIVTWTQGIQTFDDLADKDVTYKGLMSRDFRITRKGSGLQTKYVIEPANPDGGPQELSTADVKLAESKPDLQEKITPPGYSDFVRKLSGGGGGGVTDGAPNPNPFLRDN
jgi:hypothetical protein